jgi:hypothetical protein
VGQFRVVIIVLARGYFTVKDMKSERGGGGVYTKVIKEVRFGINEADGAKYL